MQCWNNLQFAFNEVLTINATKKKLQVIIDNRSLATTKGGSGKKISDAKISDAKVSDAKNSDAKISQAKVSDAKKSDAKISDAKITDAKISHAKISDAKISDAKISDAKISDAKISDEKISGAKISVAKISDAKISYAKISDAKISDAKLLTTLKESHRFIKDCIVAVGACEEHAEIIADHLTKADSRGVYSHGMSRLERFIKDVQLGQCYPNARPTIKKETSSIALVNGNNGFGPVIGKFCMNLAVKKARECGIGFVSVHGSNHFGTSGYYALDAVDQKCIGLAFTNSSPFMVPTGARDTALGTNPISCGAPGLKGDNFIMDLATTAVAFGKIEYFKRKGLPVPLGFAVNNEGKMETNTDIVLRTQKLMPIGGVDLNSKGYGLAMMVEILSGILSGSSYGPKVRKTGNYEEQANIGHGFLALDPKFFASGFQDRLSDLMNYLRRMKPMNPKFPVIVHGDPERKHLEKVKKDGGIFYVKNQHDYNAKLAAELKVKPMVSTPVNN